VIVIEYKYKNMASMNIQIKNNSQNQKMVIELDAVKFEKLVASFGFFSDDFCESVERAEKDYKAGRVKKIKSLQFDF